MSFESDLDQHAYCMRLLKAQADQINKELSQTCAQLHEHIRERHRLSEALAEFQHWIKPSDWTLPLAGNGEWSRW
jgi:hypothetical protein